MPSTAWKPWRRVCCRWSGKPSVDRVEHDDRDLAIAGLLLVIVVGRPEHGRVLPELRPLLAARGARPRLELLGGDLNLDLGMGEDVLVPAGMIGRTALRGDDEVAVARLAVEQ